MRMQGVLLGVSALCSAILAQDENFEKLAARVPGTPGEDYPIFSTPIDTSFMCEFQPVEGYYADQEADCQLYHVCSDIGDGLYSKFDFLCPNGTIFNQEEFVCDWWFNVDCSQADTFYDLNIEVAEKNAERKRLRELEREGKSEDRKRKELSFEEINDIRNGVRQEKEQPRSSNTKQKPKPFSSQLKVSNNPFTGSSKQNVNSFRGSNSFGVNNHQTVNSVNSRPKSNSLVSNTRKENNSFRSSNSQSAKPFGGNNRQSANSFTKPRQTSIVLRGKNNEVVGNRKHASSSTRSQGKQQRGSRTEQSQKQTGKTGGRTRNKGKQTKRGKQNKTKKSNVKAFTNFGNGQSRFGNF